MGELVNGRFVPSEEEDILDTLIDVAEDYWDVELNDNEYGIIKTLYSPVAYFFAQMQQDIRLVLDSSQLEFAEGQALDFLVQLIGLQRRPAVRATGSVTFRREDLADVDYSIPRGTVVQTDTIDPIVFRTTEAAIMNEGGIEVDVPVEAVEPGIDSNVGPMTLTVIVDNLPAAGQVENRGSLGGGENEETDENLRARAKDELNGGMKATPNAIINELKQTEGVKSVTLFINDSSTDNTDSGGLPDHHFEAVVEGGEAEDIAKTLVDTKAVADGIYSGAHGQTITFETTLANNQRYTIEFSRPTIFNVNLEATIDIDEDKFSGISFVKDSIIRYLGGNLTTGDEEDGDLRVGEDVIRAKVEHAIMEVNGVTDIEELILYDESGNEVEKNIPVNLTEIATSSATDNSMNIVSVS